MELNVSLCKGHPNLSYLAPILNIPPQAKSCSDHNMNETGLTEAQLRYVLREGKARGGELSMGCCHISVLNIFKGKDVLSFSFYRRWADTHRKGK